MRRCLLAVLLALATVCAFAIDPIEFRDQREELRFQALVRELRCLVCQNQNLADSDADLARDLRHEIFEMMRAGKTDAEIKQFLKDRYGDFVLYKPPVQTNTALLWFGPFLVLALGGIVVTVIVRRRAKAAGAELPPLEEVD